MNTNLSLREANNFGILTLLFCETVKCRKSSLNRRSKTESRIRGMEGQLTNAGLRVLPPCRAYARFSDNVLA